MSERNTLRFALGNQKKCYPKVGGAPWILLSSLNYSLGPLGRKLPWQSSNFKFQCALRGKNCSDTIRCAISSKFTFQHAQLKDICQIIFRNLVELNEIKLMTRPSHQARPFSFPCLIKTQPDNSSSYMIKNLRENI